MKRSALLFAILCTVCAYAQLTQYVNPFIGTSEHGHTFPGATLPFGMVQLSPDTDTQGWDWCSGYHSSDSSLLGFSHTHLSGTGGADLGDVLVKPVSGKLYLTPGDKQHKTPGYRSLFTHKDEFAEPGYYKVSLAADGITAELTAAARVGMHKYTYRNNDSVYILIDLSHGISDRAIHSSIKIVNNTTITGLRQSRGWAKNQYVYFTITFSEPFTKTVWAAGDEPVQNQSEQDHGIRVAFGFPSAKNKTVLLKVAISAVDEAGATKNLQEEIPGWDFSKVRNTAKACWETELKKIIVEGNKEDKVKFYTALYHCMICPNVFSDVDGRYRGMDNKIHTAEGYTHYTLFSLWDTFRALHPLLTIIDRGRTRDFILSLLDKYDQYGLLPVWELNANETNCMIGYHAVPVIADAITHNIPGFDYERAFNAMKTSAFQTGFSVPQYNKYGFIPADLAMDNVSRTIEYAIDDWCIAQTAQNLGKKSEAETFINRAMRYQNLYDSKSGFFRARLSNGLWKEPFDPTEIHPWNGGDYTEGNAWQYSWLPFQSERTLQINTIKKLDGLFTTHHAEDASKLSDVTGLIGEYAHGNEPSHWTVYLYATLDAEDKTQFRVRDIMDRFYGTGRDGLIGNEDCGQMSAWFVFSAMGFYPVMPSSGEYVFGSPLFTSVKINLENGKTIQLSAPGNTKSNVYVNRILLNGRELNSATTTLSDFIHGAVYQLKMSSVPGFAGTTKLQLPLNNIAAGFSNTLVFAPYLASGKTCFRDSQQVILACSSPATEIHYTLDGSVPGLQSPVYKTPFTVSESTVLQAFAVRRNSGLADRLQFSLDTLKATMYNTIFRDSINPYYQANGTMYPIATNLTEIPDDYHASGTQAMIDGKRAGISFKDPNWQSREKNDNLDVIIDFGKPVAIDEISLGVLSHAQVWILYPEYIQFYQSDDGKHFVELAKTMCPENTGYIVEKQDISSGKVNANARYIKVVAKKPPVLPSWHQSAGKPALMFADEIIIHPKR